MNNPKLTAWVNATTYRAPSDKLYILDYKGDIVGNPKGYLTAKGCNTALNSKVTINGAQWRKLEDYLQDLHQQALENGHNGTLIYETKYISK